MSMWRLVAILAAIAAVVLGVLRSLAERPVHPMVLGAGGYDIEPIVAPIATGVTLRLLSAIMSNDWIGPVLSRILMNGNDLHLIRQLAQQTIDPAVHMPMRRLDATAMASHKADAGASRLWQPVIQVGHKFRGVLDFHEEYKSSASAPLQETQRVLKAARTVGKRLGCFVEILEKTALEEAIRSSHRWASGKELGFFDGIPFVVKDEIAVKGTVTGDGFSRPGRDVAMTDDIVVARLRAAGGILIGKTVMTTFGMSPLGFNPDFQGALNAYNTSHYSGGSSAGSAAAVAAGIVPVAIGLDGGGSIRLPAAFSGVLGLAPTFGRVPFSTKEAAVMSVIKIGPIAPDVVSLAIAYEIVARPAPEHFYSELYGAAGPPPPHLAGFGKIETLRGIRLGVFTPHFKDASPSVVEGCESALRAFEKLGATIVEVTIPHMKILSLAHSVTIGTEMGGLHDADWWQHRQHIMPDSAIELGLFRGFSGKEHISAMMVKGWAMRWMKEQVFSKVDVYVSPAAGTTAPPLSEDAKQYGESNVPLLMKVMKFIFLANFIGTPGISVPVGYEEDTSLPISLHMMSAHWDEAMLIRLAHVLQTVIPRKKPLIFAETL